MTKTLTISLALAVGCLGASVAHAQLPTLEGIDGEIARAATELDAANARRDRVSTEIHELVAQRDAAQRRVRTRVNALYRLRRAGMLPLAGGFDALLRHQSRIERLERMVAHDVDALRSLTRRVAVLSDETARLTSDAQLAERTVSSLRERRASLERASASLFGAALAPAPESQATWSDGFGLRVVDGAPIGPRFEDLRGRLAMPVGGSASLSDAEREGGAGVALAASPGVSVRAAASGRVAYAARHPAYGQLVILEHDGGYYTVYGGLGSVAVHVGQTIASESALGTTGADAVFFQVRRGTRPLAAREWLGL